MDTELRTVEAMSNERGLLTDPDALLKLSARVTPPSTTGFAQVVAAPSKGYRRLTYRATELAGAALLAEPAQPQSVVRGLTDELAGWCSRTELVQVVFYARSLLDFVPAHARNDETRYQEQLDAYGQGMADKPRLLVATTSRAWFWWPHPARRVGGVFDTWMPPMIADANLLGAGIQNYVGVIVVCPRCPNASTHVAADGRAHSLGQCPDCRLSLRARL